MTAETTCAHYTAYMRTAHAMVSHTDGFLGSVLTYYLRPHSLEGHLPGSSVISKVCGAGPSASDMLHKKGLLA